MEQALRLSRLRRGRSGSLCIACISRSFGRWQRFSFLLYYRLPQRSGLCRLKAAVADGIPDDWTSPHNLIFFPDPGSFTDAVAQGRLAQWFSVRNDPASFSQLSASTSAPPPQAEVRLHLLILLHYVIRSRIPPPLPVTDPESDGIEGDWSYRMGSATAKGTAGVYPAKFSFNPTTAASCSDFVVYPTGVAGSGTTVPSLIAFTNLYNNSGCVTSSTAPAPTVKWLVNLMTPAP